MYAAHAWPLACTGIKELLWTTITRKSMQWATSGQPFVSVASGQQLHPLHARWHAPLRLASSRCRPASSRCRPNELIGGGLCMQCACRWLHGCTAARQSEPGLDLVGWWAVWLGLAWQVPADADAKYQLNIGLPEQKACLVKCVRFGTAQLCIAPAAPAQLRHIPSESSRPMSRRQVQRVW